MGKEKQDFFYNKIPAVYRKWRKGPLEDEHNRVYDSKQVFVVGQSKLSWYFVYNDDEYHKHVYHRANKSADTIKFKQKNPDFTTIADIEELEAEDKLRVTRNVKRSEFYQRAKNSIDSEIAQQARKLDEEAFFEWYDNRR